MTLCFAWGGPALTGVLKSAPEDFVVEETLTFAADGLGEHDLLWIEKRGANTEWVARGLARFAKVPQVAVGFAGLKDRHAVTRQHFTVQLPGRQVDWSSLALPGVLVLRVERHSRKLKRGALSGNAFDLLLREVSGDRERANTVLGQLQRMGAPNYFGEQRFGHAGGNLDLARRLFAGAQLERADRSFAVSAARSAIFNNVLDRRVREGTWNQIIDGELCNLAGKRAWFGPVEPDPTLAERCASGDIHPTGPLWGHPLAPTAARCAELEQQYADNYADLAAGLVAMGAESERRALRAMPENLQWSWLNDHELRLRFGLPPGAYATALIRELIEVRGNLPAGVDSAD